MDTLSVTPSVTREMLILREIEIAERIHFNGLKRRICFEKKYMSERTFREILKLLVRRKRVLRTSNKGEQKVYYSLHSHTSKFVEFVETRLKEHNSLIQEKLKMLKASFAGLHPVEQSNILAPLVRIIGISKVDSMMAVAIYGNDRIEQERKILDKLVNQLFHLVTDSVHDAESKQNMLHLIYYINDSELVHDSEQFDIALRMYTYEK